MRPCRHAAAVKVRGDWFTLGVVFSSPWVLLDLNPQKLKNCFGALPMAYSGNCVFRLSDTVQDANQAG